MHFIFATLSVRRLFLIDAIGASVTAVMLGALLTTYEPTFGMPKRILIRLSVVAMCFGVYSLTCHLRAAGPRFLLGIAVANTLYCVSTLSLIMALHDSLTWLGIAYFAGEILIIATLVLIEVRVALAKQGERPP